MRERGQEVVSFDGIIYIYTYRLLLLAVAIRNKRKIKVIVIHTLYISHVDVCDSNVILTSRNIGNIPIYIFLYIIC